MEVFYWIGSFDPVTVSFRPDQEEPQLIDVGDFHFTGPSGMVDPVTGRSLVFTIAQGDRTAEAEYRAGWAHNGGLPLHVYLREDGRLGLEPIHELEKLRAEKLVSLENVTVREANERLQTIQEDMLEIRVELEAWPDREQAAQASASQELSGSFGGTDPSVTPRPAGTANAVCSGSGRILGLKLKRSPGGEEETLLGYDWNQSRLFADRTRTTLDPRERCGGIQEGRLELAGENLRLHVYVDRSMIEAYANGLKSLTTRAYTSRKDSLGLRVWGPQEARVVSLELWRMKSAWIQEE
ncbi:GH32 C-terminal domain-containing protein [Paenibacillus sp. CC-CFT747]|nr:GH32 C-terminal domain-containing protein [Paenibacillus sp. CC-CFT747]